MMSLLKFRSNKTNELKKLSPFCLEKNMELKLSNRRMKGYFVHLAELGDWKTLKTPISHGLVCVLINYITGIVTAHFTQLPRLMASHKGDDRSLHEERVASCPLERCCAIAPPSSHAAKSAPVFSIVDTQYDDDEDEIAYFTVRWKTRASFVYRTKNMR